MLPEEVIKYFTNKDEEYGIVEIISSSILPMNRCKEKIEHINWKWVDKVNLYKVVDDKPILIEEIE